MSLSRDNVKAEVFLLGVNARIIKKKHKSADVIYQFMSIEIDARRTFSFSYRGKNAHDHENK